MVVLIIMCINVDVPNSVIACIRNNMTMFSIKSCVNVVPEVMDFVANEVGANLGG